MKRNIFLAAWLFVLVPMLVQAQERIVPMPNLRQLESAHVRVLFQDSEGYMWYGMKSDGLYRDDGYSLTSFRADFLHPDWLMNNNVTAICEDSRNRLWVGTKRGLYILDKHDYSIRPTGDQKLQIWTFDALKAGEGDSVLAYANKHLLVYDGEGKCLSQTPVEKNPLVTQDRRKLTDLRGNFWQIDDDGIPSVTIRPSVMLTQVALDTLPLRCMLPPSMSGLPSEHKVHAVWKTDDGTRWTGTSDGLWMVRPDSGDGECEQVGPNFGVVNTLSLGKDGTVYMNTEWQGLVSYKDELITRLDTTIRNASGLFLDKNNLWICTTSGRLLLYDVTKKTLDDLSAKCYLHGDIPLGIAVLKGNVWVLFNQRILIYSPSKKSMRYIYPSDLDPQPAFFRAIYTDGVGRIFLECEKDYFEVQMKQPSKQEKGEKIALAAYQTIHGTRCPGMDTHQLNLTADERVVHLFFTTFDHLGKQHVRFAFRRDGESEWNYLEMGQNDVRITKLSKGKHTIEVMATNANGQWGKDVFTMTIQCEPYWWETVGAYIAYVLLAVLLLSFSFWLGRKMKLS
ncbi:MAG: hypothetical protein IJ635_05545 [Bacteroidaceae bacterium]|nr:hypothetical protein [Bacteroidaceae bacterium]